MLNILATGTLVSDPMQRQSAAGKAYATASMRVPTEDGEAMLASLIAFNADAVTSLLALSRNDPLSVAGRAKVSEWLGRRLHRLVVKYENIAVARFAAAT